MAKKSMIARDVKRQKLVDRYAAKRAALMAAFEAAGDPMERLEIHRKIQNLPRNSARVRLRNRCWATGKPRGVYRDFGLCRNQLRERAHKGELICITGNVKAEYLVKSFEQRRRKAPFLLAACVVAFRKRLRLFSARLRAQMQELLLTTNKT